MIKYYCDRCGTELGSSRYFNHIELRASDNSNKEWELCSSCCVKLHAFMNTSEANAT